MNNILNFYKDILMDKHILIIFLLIIIIFVPCILAVKEHMKNHHDHHMSNNQSSNESYPCSTYLSDEDYLKHMIPHHQVAIDISLLLQQKTTNPTMQKILRELIWTQQYEIEIMTNLLKNRPHKASSSSEMSPKYRITEADIMSPNIVEISNTYCDPHFFDPEKHNEHLKHMTINDKMYIEHMIPHHQVAIDMSKKLIENTDNDFMIYLAYRIIRSQSREILLLSDLSDQDMYSHDSSLLYGNQ